MPSLQFRTMVFVHRLVRGIANRVVDRSEILPRPFSNAMLRRFAPMLSGDVLNVSGWRDEDGEGGCYFSYFQGARSYAVSNVAGQEKGLGASAAGYAEVSLDLSAPLQAQLVRAFDVVFNHTTLEHIYDFRRAFQNICEMSRDAVILVVPVMQQIHHSADFGDYWRPTTLTIDKMFRDNGFTPLILKCNDQPFAPIYCFAIAVRDPSKYADRINRELDYEMGSFNYGSSLRPEHIRGLIERG